MALHEWGGVLTFEASQFVRHSCMLVVKILLANECLAAANKTCRHRKVEKVGFRLAAVAMVILAAQSGFDLLSSMLGGSDVLFWCGRICELTFNIPTFCALLCLCASIPHYQRARSLIDSSIVAASIAVAGLYFTILPTLTASTLEEPKRTICLVLPTLNIVAFSIVLAAFLTTWRAIPYRRPIGYFATTYALVILADSMFYPALGSGSLTRSVVPELLWSSGYAVYFLGISRWPTASRIATEQSIDHAPSEHRIVKIAKILAPFFLGGGALTSVVIHQSMTSGKLSIWVVGAVLTLGLLIGARQAITLNENRHLRDGLTSLNQNLERLVVQRTKQLQTMISVSRSLAEGLDFQELRDNALPALSVSLGADALCVHLDEEYVKDVRRVHSNRLYVGREKMAPFMKSISHLVTMGIVACGQTTPSEEGDSAGYMIAPLNVGHRSIGSLIALRQSGPFEESNFDLLLSVANEVGSAVERARLYELTREQADFDTLTGMLNHRAGLDRLDIELTMAETIDSSVGVLVIDVDNFKHFNDTYGHSVGDDVLREVADTILSNTRAPDTAVRYGGDEFVAIFPGVSEHDLPMVARRLETAVAEIEFFEQGTNIRIPISISVGFACFPFDGISREQLFQEADLSMYRNKRNKRSGVSAVSPSVRGERKSESGPSLILDSLITAIDNKDSYTRTHSLEVMEYSLWIAEELGLDRETFDTVRLSALLHDVGKIGIPDSVLRKPGMLSPEDVEIMKQHPVIGTTIVGGIPGLEHTLDGVRHHHERYDGKGYPDMLQGDDIPFLGRLLAVPDAFSAMTTDRPYRKAMGWDEALARIELGSGTQFDPVIAQAFIRAVNERRTEFSSTQKAA